MAGCAPIIAAIAVVALILPPAVRAKDREKPDARLWHMLKETLTGPDGQTYFEMDMKGSQLPLLVGKLVSAEPADRPSVLVLQMYDSDRPEVTLHLTDGRQEAHMPGPIAIGSSIRFLGI